MRKPCGVRSVASCSSVVGALLIAAVCAAAPSANAPRSDEQTVQYLNQTVDWYRRVSTAGQASVTSQDVLYRDSVRKQAHWVAVLGFRFARNEAALLDERAGAAAPATGRGAPGDRVQQLANRLAVAEQRAATLRTRLDALDAEVRGGAATTRPALADERATVASQLNFASALRDTLLEYSAFSARVQGRATGNVRRQVEDLARTVPEVSDAEGSTPATTQPSTAVPAPADAVRPESAGIVRLITELFGLSQRMGELSALANQTAELSKANDAIRDPMRTDLQAAVARADALGAATHPAGGAAAQQQQQQQELDALAERFRELAGAAVPIGEQKLLLDRTHDTLLEWRHSLGQQYAAIVRHLAVRLVVMGVIILVVLGISAIWRRATFRYVSDSRRQRQFLLLRRIVVGALVTIIFIAGFVAELGTLATFAGLITAGIAVSLQTVILSAVAYFFYIGRYGVRVGDRVTVGGVTGDVVDVGLFRLYLMELGGTHLKQKPTGRVAVFSNSVLFGASGFFRQIPGAEYGWHEVALTLAPTSNFRLAEERLLGAVEKEYAKYQGDLHRQHASAARTFHLPVPEPKPEGRLRFVDAGLEFVLRYPVELREAAEVDDRVTRALLDAIAREPTLKLVAAGTPTVQSAG